MQSRWSSLRGAPPPATTIHVGIDPTSPFTTVQAARDAASVGDVSVVADGVYNGSGGWDIDLRGKAVSVRSIGGPERCLIDGQGRGLPFCGGEGVDSILDGFTIRDGRADRGAGIGYHCPVVVEP
jgi:hypothetical protein